MVRSIFLLSNLGSTRDAYVQVWGAQINKVIDKIEDFFSCTWQAEIVCINPEINGAPSRE
jgi:hypothetical protein